MLVKIRLKDKIIGSGFVADYYANDLDKTFKKFIKKQYIIYRNGYCNEGLNPRLMLDCDVVSFLHDPDEIKNIIWKNNLTEDEKKEIILEYAYSKLLTYEIAAIDQDYKEVYGPFD